MRRFISPVFWVLLLVTLVEEATWFIPFLSLFLWLVLFIPRVGLLFSYILIRYFYEAKGRLPTFAVENQCSKKGRVRSTAFWILLSMAVVEDVIFIFPLLSLIVWGIILFPSLGLRFATLFGRFYEEVTGIPVTEARTKIWRYIESKQSVED